jgi:predicted CXXCH cytochrome family protein
MPHGSKNPLLVILGGDDGSEAKLCSVCHKHDLSDLGIGRYSHPIGVVLEHEEPVPTYPNGVAIRLNGQDEMVCLSCHDMHDSASREYILRHAPPGSGLCVACHEGYTQGVEGTGHDLSVSAPESQNVLGETTEEAGVCSSCHVAHKGRMPYMWARNARGGRHPQERLCLSCHSIGGVAFTRINPLLGHPTPIDKNLIRVQAGESDLSLDVPVYDLNGRPVDKGWVTCLTCHNPHHWRPEGVEEPEQTEYPPPGQGTVLNSFLRVRSEDQICKHCHGVWGLWRYRFFHTRLRNER